MSDGWMLALKTLALVLAIAMYLSSAPTIRRIHKAQHTGDTQLLPLVCLLVNCHQWMLYSVFSDEIYPLTFSCSIGEIGAFFFVLVFVRISPEKAYSLKVCSIACVVMVLVTTYAVLAWAGLTGQTNHQTSVVMGYIGLVTDAFFYGSPFATIRRVLRTRSAATIPIAMCAMGTFCNLTWALYSTLESDVFVFIPNAVCFFLGLSQVLLYVKFNPNKLTGEAENGDQAAVSVCVALSPKHSEAMGVASPSFQALHSPLAPLDHKPSAVEQRL